MNSKVEKAYYKYKYDWDCILRYDEVDTAKNSTDKPNKNNNPK